jgi:hypothetical protein
MEAKTRRDGSVPVWRRPGVGGGGRWRAAIGARWVVGGRWSVVHGVDFKPKGWIEYMLKLIVYKIAYV